LKGEEMENYNLLEVESTINQTKQEISNEKKRHEDEMGKFNKKLEYYNHIKSMLMNNIDANKVENAKKFIRTEGVRNHFDGDASSQLAKAKQDVIDDFKILRREYIACKNYDRFIGQGLECQYGYGPRHGYVVFRIGLWDTDAVISDEDKCDILYYLNLLDNKETRDKVLQENE
jgi:hypothetical protein